MTLNNGTKMTEELWVIPDILTLPNGFDDQNRPRITLQIVPRRVEALPEGALKIDLRRWPEAIATLSENIRVEFQGGVIEGMKSGLSRHWNADTLKNAVSVWTQAFQDEAGVKDLYEALSTIGDEIVTPTNKQSSRSFDVQRLLSGYFQRKIELDAIVKSSAGQDKKSVQWASAAKQESERWRILLLDIIGSVNSNDSVRQSPRILSTKKAALSADGGISVDDLIASLKLETSSDSKIKTSNARGITAFRERLVNDLATAWLPDDVPDQPISASEGKLNNKKTYDDDDKVIESTAKRRLVSLLSYPTICHYLGLGVTFSVDADNGIQDGLGKIRAYFDGMNELSGWSKYQPAWSKYRLDSKKRLFSLAKGLSDSTLENGLVKLGEGNKFRLGDMNIYQTLLRLEKELVEQGNAEIEGREENLFKDVPQTRERRGIVVYQNRDGEKEDTYLEHSADNCLQGYRPDVYLVSQSGNYDVKRWRSVTGRQIICTEIARGDPDYYQLTFIKEISFLDDGLAARPEKEVIKEGQVVTDLKFDEIFEWSGESLAVARNSSTRGAEFQYNPDEDLNLKIKFNLAGLPGIARNDTLLPPLREGRNYFYGCRAVFPMGVSLEPEIAHEMYSGSSNVSYVLGAKPGLKDPFNYSPDIIGAPPVHLRLGDRFVRSLDIETSHPGEAVDVLAVKPTSRKRQRLISPPRVDFDRAEMQGQFDASGAVTVGTLKYVKLDPKLWVFPVAKDGGIEWPSDQKPKGKSRGTVMCLNAKIKTSGDLFVDANVSDLQVCIKSADGNLEASQTLSFRHPTEAGNHIPIALTVEKSENFSITTNTTLQLGAVTLPQILIKLASADDYTLRLKCDGTQTDEFNKFSELRLVSPVKAPVMPEAPEISSFFAVSTTITHKNDWQIYLEANEVSGSIPSTEGGATTYFAGRIGVDRKTSEAVRLTAKWNEYDLNVFARDKEDRWTKNISSESAKLFDIKLPLNTSPKPGFTEPQKHINDAITVDVSRGIQDEIRGLAFQFRDGRARKLELVSTATSRFREFYAESESSDKFELDSAPSELITKCTFRPPKPKINRIEPVFIWTDLSHKRRHRFERNTSLRVFLDEDWYASGYGEVLGLVLPKSLQDLENKKFGTFFSTIASDVFFDPQTTATLLKPENFYLTTEKNEHIENVRIYRNEEDYINANILSFEIEFDEKLGPYCDIQPKRFSAFAPFFNFSFVRYQPHGENRPLGKLDLRASEPVRKGIQLLPARQGKFEKKKRTLQFEMSGQTWTRTEPLGGIVSGPRVQAQILLWDDEKKRHTSYDRIGKPLPRITNLKPKKSSKGEWVWSYSLNLRDYPRTLAKDFSVRIEEVASAPGVYDDPTKWSQNISFSRIIKAKT